MPSADSLVVVIGTGGTIAGAATRPGAHLGYQAGALAAQALVDAVPALAGRAVEAHSLAQLDSSDMDHATWRALARAVAAHWARVRRAQGARKATAKTASPERSATMALDIPLHLRGCRLRVTEAQANVGTHAWDVSTPGAWDANSDAAAYCLDAIDAIPAGSTRELSRGPGPRCILREPYPCDEVRDSKAAP
jgi:hypothetical protein